MFASFLEKAKGAVKDAAGKVQKQANGMAKLLNSRVHVAGDSSYLVNPSQYVLEISSSPSLYAMKCPVENAEVVYSGQVELATVAAFLNKNFGSKYLVVNLSDVPYDSSLFRGDVQDFFFPGYPAPPIKVIVQMCVAVDAWLAKQRKAARLSHNLGVEGANTPAQGQDLTPPAVLFHCKTGKGRTAVALACYLAWSTAEASPVGALDRVCASLAMPVEMVTIPSQRRYVEYFTNILDGAKPAARKLILSRVIVNAVPQFGVASPGTVDRPGQPGCNPELRIVKNGKVVFKGHPYAPPAGSNTSTLSSKSVDGDIEVLQDSVSTAVEGSLAATNKTDTSTGGSAKTSVGKVRAGDGSIKFEVELETQQDVVMSCYHVEPRGTAPGSRWKRVFMFRAQFYTGFVRENMLRFTRAALDGTNENEDRFPDDFFVEAFFESHPIGNDYRLPSSWKAIHERSRRIKAKEQAARQRAERKAAKKAQKKQAKKRDKHSGKRPHARAEPALHKAKRDVHRKENAGALPTASGAGGKKSPASLVTARSSRSPLTADDEYFSDASDSDSSASGASARAAQTSSPSASLPHEFQITFSDGDDDDEDDDGKYVVAEAEATKNQGSGASSQASNTTITSSTTSTSAGNVAPTLSTDHAERTPNSEAWLKQLDQELNSQFGEASYEPQHIASGTGLEVLEPSADRPQAGSNPGAEDAAVVLTESSHQTSSNADPADSRPESVQSGSASSPSSTTTVENSDGWDACATDADDGVLALGADAVIDDSDAALADIESFLNNLDTM